MVSVIIPCFNSGDYIKESVESVRKNYSDNDYEIIITNDGSTDLKTIENLKLLEQNDCIVLHQKNSGPAAARNTAAKVANGEYLFFLDSDNLLKKNYIEKGLAIFKKEKHTGVVYGKPIFFGENLPSRFGVKAFDLRAMLFNNYIDTCSLVRKQTWQDTGGFDENKILIGHEDWDFWIRVFMAGWKFHFINEELYSYRLNKNSLITRINKKERHLQMKTYMFNKHAHLFIDAFGFFGSQYYIYKKDQQQPFRSFIKFLRNKYLRKK